MLYKAQPYIYLANMCANSLGDVIVACLLALAVTRMVNGMNTNLPPEPPSMCNDALLTKRALAARLRIAPRTLDSWMKKGHVPYLKVKKSVRFVFADVLRKLNEQYRVN